MKRYYYQLSTGLIFRTTREIVYTQQGYCIDKQAVTPEDSYLSGCIYIIPHDKEWEVNDMIFKSSDVVASWEENS